VPRVRVRIVRRIGLPLLVVLAAACASSSSSVPPSVVLVTVDTLRADHLGFYGYGPATSPFLDQLAARSTVFAAATATCPATAPSIASILTGVHRATHGVHRNGGVLRADVTTLAERLASAGYRTLSRGSNPVLAATHGFAQGFDEFLLPPYAPASVTG